MHYYKRNLGDYAKKCGRLSMLQHGAYTLLIDSCYDREKFPTLDEAIEWTWASTEAEIEAVKFVLTRFFKLDDDGQYVQDRILAELLDYHSKADKNKQIAVDRETKRREKITNRAQNVNETPPNQEPITINQEPKVKASASGSRLPQDWRPSEEDKAYFREKCPGKLIAPVAENFHDYWIAKPGAAGRKLDWSATWRTWVRREAGDTGPGKASGDARDWLKEAI